LLNSFVYSNKDIEWFVIVEESNCISFITKYIIPKKKKILYRRKKEVEEKKEEKII
jgi:hypothetical protein